jgi:hypothetical protein
MKRCRLLCCLARIAPFLAAACCVLLFVNALPAQIHSPIKSKVADHMFRNENLNLTFTFPEALTPQPLDQIPKDANGREQILLALWDTPRSTPEPRLVLEWDALIRPANLSPDNHCTRLSALAQARTELQEGQS